jgi:hypothetical protein
MNGEEKQNNSYSFWLVSQGEKAILNAIKKENIYKLVNINNSIIFTNF